VIKNRIKEQPTRENCIEDIFYLLDIIEEIGNINCKINEDDVVEIFCKSNTKKICLTELAVYKSSRKPKFGKPKELASFMFADLVIRGYVDDLKEMLRRNKVNGEDITSIKQFTPGR
jgi:hypothetical protein